MSPNISQAGAIVPQYLVTFSAFFRILLRWSLLQDSEEEQTDEQEDKAAA